MTPTQALNLLRGYNAWRRGDLNMTMPDPEKIGIAIDTVCAALELLLTGSNPDPRAPLPKPSEAGGMTPPASF